MSKDLYVKDIVSTQSYSVDATNWTNIMPSSIVCRYILVNSTADLYFKFSVSSTSNTEIIKGNTQNWILDIDQGGFSVKAKTGTATVNVAYYN